MLPGTRFLLLAALLVPMATAQTRRPLTHGDYDGWRSISTQRLSPDGKRLAYAVFPQEGDGEIVVRDLTTGKETRAPAGQRPAPPSSTSSASLLPGEEGPQQANVTLTFSEDSRTLACTVFPSRGEIDKAKKEKKPAEEMPKNGLLLIDLAQGKVQRVERVKSFRMPLKSSGYIAWLREAAPKPVEEKKPENSKDGDQRGSSRGGPSTSARRPEFGTELTLRALYGGAAERTIADVVEYSFSDDGKDLVYTVSSREPAGNGFYRVRPGDAAAPAALLSGKGKYARLAWDERQTRVVFASDRDDNAARQPKWKLYLWTRGEAGAGEIVSAATPGWRAEFVLSDRGTLAFSKDGSRIFFSVAPPAAPRAEASSAPADDRPVVDLWHWKDDYIQPMQKVRAERDRNRTYAAAYRIEEKRVVQVGDPTLPEVFPGESADWAVGGDDRAYRRMVEYDERYSDAWAVNLATGERRLLAKKHRGTPALSPGGAYALLFDGADWIAAPTAGGEPVNLTGKLGVRFHNEEHDTPGTPSAYGLGGFTRDGRALLYDRCDVWLAPLDGGPAVNLTAGVGRKRNLQFRAVRFANEDDPRDRWFDPARPLLLRAEHLETRETGFWRTRIGSAAPPEKLIMAARNFGTPIKARNAEVYAFSAQTFRECPDLHVADANFKELRKATDINPQQRQFLWGTARHIRYRNMDGVPMSGVLYQPETLDPKKKYPLMVYIYERLSQQLHRYVEPRPSQNVNFTYYVSNGYLVLTPDIVYTVGFPGPSALKAVLPAVQAVVDLGIVDEKAIGIQGHSWGGYQIAYMITQTDRFRAASAGAPVANMISAYDGIRWGPGLPRQFQYERTQSRIGGSIWQYPTRFIENSPIFWADRVKTPLMMLHNDGDDAVPWQQGIEYYLALRRLGKEVYLFNYNGEPHGIRKRPNQKDYTVRLQQYFDHYLKGAPAPDWMVKGVPYLERDRTAGGAEK